MALLYCSLVSRLLLSTIVGIECTTDARVPCCQGRVHRLGCVCSYRQVVHIHAAYARAAACTLRVVVCELGYITCAALFRFACAAGSDLLCTVRITVHHVVGSVWGSRLNAESGQVGHGCPALQGHMVDISLDPSRKYQGRVIVKCVVGASLLPVRVDVSLVASTL